IPGRFEQGTPREPFSFRGVPDSAMSPLLRRLSPVDGDAILEPGAEGCDHLVDTAYAHVANLLRGVVSLLDGESRSAVDRLELVRVDDVRFEHLLDAVLVGADGFLPGPDEPGRAFRFEHATFRCEPAAEVEAPCTVRAQVDRRRPGEPFLQ